MNPSLSNSYRIEIDNSLVALSSSLEVNLAREWSKIHGSMDFSVRMLDLPKPYGFEIAITENFLNWELNLKFDDFSKGLFEKFSENFNNSTEVFLEYIKIADEKSKKFTFEVNHESILSSEPSNDWDSIDFKMTRTFTNLDDAPKVLDSTLLDSFAILLPLAGIVSLEEDEGEVASELDEGFKEEGKKVTHACAKYERSRFNRRICLNHYGYRCAVCGLVLGEKYGEAGRNVIHVHHLTPVSLMNGPKVLNPIKDLVPLCPNCHNVAHTKLPPYTPEELRNFLNLNQNGPE